MMTLSVRLSPTEEQLLNITARRLGCSKSDLAREAIHEFCQKMAREEHSPYCIGQDLFGAGELAKPPSNPLKREIWEKLRDKHGCVG